MSLSTLPGIFRQSSTTQTNCRRQGGSFSLYLKDQITDRHPLLRNAYSSMGSNYKTLSPNKIRSTSTTSVRIKPSILKKQKSQSKSKETKSNEMNFNQENQFLRVKNSKSKVGFSIMSISNFAYPTTSRFHSSNINLEETDNLYSIISFNQSQLEKINNDLRLNQRITNATKEEIKQFANQFNNDLNDFEEKFSVKLKECYNCLSRLRRQTNEELKRNRIELQKTGSQLQICQQVTNNLQVLSQKMKNEWVKGGIKNNQQTQNDEVPDIDFQQLSSIPKTSRGGTGDMSRRTRAYDFLRRNGSSLQNQDWKIKHNVEDMELGQQVYQQ